MTSMDTNLGRNGEVGVPPVSERKVVCGCQDVNAVGEILGSLSPNAFLKRRGGRSTAVYFSVEQGRDEHPASQFCGEKKKTQMTRR